MKLSTSPWVECMNQTELARLCRMHGLEVKEKKAEVIVEICLYCANSRWNLEMNAEAGVFHCWACDKGGALQSLLREFFSLDINIPINLQARTPLRKLEPVSAEETERMGLTTIQKTPPAFNYLLSRGLTLTTIEHFHLKASTNQDHEYFGRVIIPVAEYWSQQSAGVVARSFMNVRPKYLTNLATNIIVGWRRRNATTHVLVEGPFDAMQVFLSGHNAAALLGRGTSELDWWTGRVPIDDSIVVMLDGDAWDKAARMACELRTIHARTYVALLPEHLDPASLLPQTLSRMVSTVLPQESYSPSEVQS